MGIPIGCQLDALNRAFVSVSVSLSAFPFGKVCQRRAGERPEGEETGQQVYISSSLGAAPASSINIYMKDSIYIYMCVYTYIYMGYSDSVQMDWPKWSFISGCCCSVINFIQETTTDKQTNTSLYHSASHLIYIHPGIWHICRRAICRVKGNIQKGAWPVGDNKSSAWNKCVSSRRRRL